MKTIRFICHDGQPNMPPLIAAFTVDDNAETEDVIETFGKALRKFIPGSEDCPPIRYAADSVCKKYSAGVVFYEADQEFGAPVHDQTICSKCGIPLF